MDRWCRRGDDGSVELGGHFGKRHVECAEAVRQACADRQFAAISGSLGRPHGFDAQSTIDRHKLTELAVEAIDIGLDRRTRSRRERLMCVAIDLLLPSEDEAPRET